MLVEVQCGHLVSSWLLNTGHWTAVRRDKVHAAALASNYYIQHDIFKNGSRTTYAIIMNIYMCVDVRGNHRWSSVGTGEAPVPMPLRKWFVIPETRLSLTRPMGPVGHRGVVYRYNGLIPSES